MPSVSFDPVAHIYDATRGYPEDVALRIAGAIDEAVNAETQTAFLELGVGTGRIALPMLGPGRMYTGIDISEGMLGQLETKLRAADWQLHSCTVLPWGSLVDENTALASEVSRFTRAYPPSSLRLVRGTIEHLPFRDNSFDVVLAVHVFHLVGDWQQAIYEALRVLRPSGWFLYCWDGYQDSDTQLINDHWREFVKEAGGEVRNNGVSYHHVRQWLHEHGFRPEEQNVLTWEQPVVPGDVVDHIARRSWSGSWTIPDDIFEQSVKRLREWSRDYYGEKVKQERMQKRFFTLVKAHVGQKVSFQ